MKVRVLAMLAVLSVTSGMLAQATTQPQSGIDSDIALLRSDIQTQKVDIIRQTMQLTDAQSQAFWPLYREFANQQQTIGDQRVSLIKDYLDSYDTLDDTKADELEARMMKFDDARTKLRATYYPRFKKAIGAKQAAKFLQVDNRLTLLIDLQIASAVPIIQ